MNKRFIFILLFTFLITGCKATYKLDINSQSTINLDVSYSASDSNDIQIFKNYSKYVPVNIEFDDPSAFEKKLDDVEYYTIKKGNDYMDFRYRHDIDSINYDMVARSCYKYITFMKKDDSELLLSTSKDFMCFKKYDNLDDVTFIVTSKYKLKETNADEVETHKYTWHINRENANDKNIYLLLDFTTKDLTLWERIMNGEYFNVFTLFLSIIIIVGIGYLFIRRKNKKINRI